MNTLDDQKSSLRATKRRIYVQIGSKRGEGGDMSFGFQRAIFKIQFVKLTPVLAGIP